MSSDNLARLGIFLWLVCAPCSSFGAIEDWADDMEYASQAAFEGEWPMGWVGPGGTPLELSTEMSRSVSKSAKCDTARQVSTHLFDELLPAGSVEIWMYDSLTSTDLAFVWAEAGINDGSWAMVGLATSLYDNYLYRLVNEGYIDTGVPRSEGWHHILFTFGDPEVGGSIYLDEIHILDTVKLAEGCKRIRLGVDSQLDNQEVFYFDDVTYTFGLDPLEDDAETIALLHMDTSTVVDANDFVPDDDSANPGRDNDLGLGVLPGTTAPDLTTGDGGVWGEALEFSGDMAVIPGTPWLGATNEIDTVKVDLWIRPTGLSTPQGTLVGVPDVWEIYLDGRVYFRIWDADDNVVPLQGEGTIPNTWWHVVASYAGGQMTLTLNGQNNSRAAPLWKRADGMITVGNRAGAAGPNPYRGLVDELKISVPQLKCGDWGYHQADVNKDCYVNLEDFSLLTEGWSACTDPCDPFNCVIIAP